MCVDSWPTFTTAICYRQNQHFSSSSVVIPDICTVFTKNPETLRSLLLNERVVNWRNGLLFRGTPRSHYHLIKELASLHGLDITEHEGYKTFIHHHPHIMVRQQKVLLLPISVLDESHAELVNANLPYRGSRVSLIRAYIRDLPNHCVKDEQGRPVSWMLTDELCELRMAYTLPEYRRAGYILAVTQALIRRMSSAGLPVYCHVNQHNQASINLVTSLGFSDCPSLDISPWLVCNDRV